MPFVRNKTDGDLNVPAVGDHAFVAGVTVDVSEGEEALLLASPGFETADPPAPPVEPPVIPPESPPAEVTPTGPDPVVEAEAELAKAQADLEAAHQFMQSPRADFWAQF